MDPPTVAPLKFQLPVSAGSVAGPEMTIMVDVGAGVGAGVLLSQESVLVRVLLCILQRECPQTKLHKPKAVKIS